MGEGDSAGEKKRTRIMPSRVEQERLRNYRCFSMLERDTFDPTEQLGELGKEGTPRHFADEETEAQQGRAPASLMALSTESNPPFCKWGTTAESESSSGGQGEGPGQAGLLGFSVALFDPVEDPVHPMRGCAHPTGSRHEVRNRGQRAEGRGGIETSLEGIGTNSPGIL